MNRLRITLSMMMAGVLLLFVLIMCVTLFQAQKNYVEKLAEQEQRIRLQDEYAAEMLQKTTLPISEIALECGFTDSNYFSRQFRKHCNSSPREYRNRDEV